MPQLSKAVMELVVEEAVRRGFFGDLDSMHNAERKATFPPPFGFKYAAKFWIDSHGNGQVI